MKVYVVSSTTESGDDYIYLWLNKPTSSEIEAVARRDWPNEFGDDDDDYWTMNLPNEATEMETEDE